VKAIAPWLLGMSGIVVFQSTAVHSLAVHHVRPDLFLVSVLLIAMRRGVTTAVLWGTPAGFFQDLLSGGLVGFNLLSKPAVGLAVGLLREKLDFGNPNTQSAVTLAAAVAEGVLLSLLVEAYQPQKGAVWTITRVVLPSALYSAVVLPLVPQAGRLAVSVGGQWIRRGSRAE